MTDQFSILDAATDADLTQAAKTPSPQWSDALAQSTQARVRAAAVSAVDANPNHTAEAISLGARTGLPADVVSRNMPEVQRRAYLDEVDRVFSEEPALAKWHMNPINAQLTRDDLANIEKLPNLWRGVMDTLIRAPTAGAVSATGSSVAGVGELARSSVMTQLSNPETIADQERALGSRLNGPSGLYSPFRQQVGPPLDRERPKLGWQTYDALIGGGGWLKDSAANNIGVPPERQNMADKVGSAVGGFAPLIAAEILGGPAVATTMMAGMGADTQADNARRAGKYDTPEGDAAVMAGAGVNAMLQRLGFEAMLYRVPTQMRSQVLAKLTDVAAGGGIQAAQQVVLDAVQNAVTKTYLDPNQKIIDPSKMGEDALVAFMTGGIVRGATGRVQPGEKIQRERQVAATAEANAATIDRLMKGVQETNLHQRSPEKMAELLGTLGGDQKVFVPVDAVREYFQKLDPEEAQKQAQALGISDQLTEANATGGDVVIPLNQYVSHAPEDMAKAWREEIRLRSSGMSIKEAKAYREGDEAKGKEVGETVAGNLERITSENKARDDVVAQVERQLQDAGESPEAARQIAQLYGERYATRAARLGQGDAATAYDKSGVEFRSDLPETIKHAPADDLELLVRALKGKTDKSEEGGSGPTILQYIARNGGIIDDGGELHARDVHKFHIGKPFQNKVMREAPQPKGGGLPGLTEGAGDRSRYDVDAWVRRLWEEGFFPEHQERPSIGDLHNAIDQEMRGNPRRVEKLGKGWVDDFHMAVRELDEILTKAGIDARTASVEEIRTALAKMNEQGGQAYEQAVYHGSPHIFDRFTLDHIGSGEGAQAYGWGLYFAGNKAVAKYYRSALSRNRRPTLEVDGKPADFVAAREAVYKELAPEMAGIDAASYRHQLAAIMEMVGEGHSLADIRKVWPGKSEVVSRILDAIEKAVAIKPPGRLYHVEIPEDGAYLNWDKPLSEQSAEVRAAVNKLMAAHGISLEPEVSQEFRGRGTYPSRDTGAELYAALSAALTPPMPRERPGTPRGWGFATRGNEGDKAASLALREAGIPGIQYLDGGSRGAGEGSHNYVLFDDALATIKQFEQPPPDGSGVPRGNIVFSQNAVGETRSLITLFKDRNLSTVLHETGHLWLEELHTDAARSDAPAQLKDDLAKVRDWLGVKGDDALTVEQHEKWARAVEAYLMEGKSPSVALSAPLARFKAWMISVYKTVRSLHVEINDEMRGVMDRLIATDDALADARTEIGARALFASADQAGMTEAEFKAYSDSVTRSKDKAEQEVLGKLMDEVRKQRTAEWKAETDAIAKEVRPTVDSQPDIVALQYLRTGDLPESLAHLRDLPRMKLSRDALIEEYGNPEIVNALPKSVPPLVTEHGGVRPGDIAEMLGFSDGRAMIDALTRLAKEQADLKAAGDKRSVRGSRIDAEVSRVMKERHGDMLTDGSIEAEALSALHNEARSDVLATELRTLARKAGKEATPFKLARDWAKRAIAEKQVSEVSDLGQYTRAEAKAARLAEQALAKGDADEALRRKQEQMIAHALWMEARDAKAEIETARKMMDRLAGARTLKAMDQNYLEKIHDLLERFDLKARSLRSVEKSESLRQWADQQQAAGIDVAVPQKLLDEAYKTSYRRMSVEEFRGLSDSVKQLAHLGRKKQEFIDGKDKREFDAVVDTAVKAAGEGRQSGDTSTDIGKTNFQRKFGAVISKLRSADAALLKVEYLFKWLDGKQSGPFGRLFERMSKAQADERTQWGDLGNKLHALFHEIPVEARRRMQDVAEYPELNGERLRRDALISVALNMGNEGNKAKMLKGHGWTEGGVLKAIDRGLGPEEMAFVQKTWDLIETLWPQIAAMERRVNGVEPEKVEPSALTTKHGTFKGGYFPLVYEPKREAQKGDRTPDVVENMGSQFYTRATTPKGFTKDRSEGFARPIHLSLDVIPRHLMEVVHDLHWREAIMDGQRFLSDARVKNAIREKLGPEYESQLQPWLNHMAMEYAKDRQGMAGWDQFMKTLRTNVTLVGMGYRLTTILSQVGGFADSTAELGTRWMASGFKSYSAHPIDSISFVRDKSGEMKHRAETLDRDIRVVAKQMMGKDGILDPVRNFAFKGVGWADAAVTIPTWLGGYNKALHEGKTDAEAVQYADEMVRRSQGASGSKDLVRLQTSGEAGKLITMFYSYFSHYYNAQRDVGRRLVDSVKEGSAGDFGDALARAFWLNGPGVLAAQLLSGQGPEKDESWGAWAARTVFFNQFLGVPIVRDLANEASNAIAGKYVGGYQLSPMGKGLETLGQVGHDAMSTVKGKPADRAPSHALNMLGYLTALPTGQLATTTQYLYDALWSKKVAPNGVVDWMKGLVYGPPPKK